MSGRPMGVGLAAGLVLLVAVTVRAEPEFGPRDRSTSSSRQFVVYSGDPTVRAVVTTGVDDLKRGLLKVLKVRDAWVYPIVITVRPASVAQPGLAPVEVRLFATDAGPKLEINVRSGKVRGEVSFARELVRALLLELALRVTHEEKVSRMPEPVPDWLVEGMAELVELATGEGARRPDLYRKLLESGRICSIEVLLRGTSAEFDSATRDIHRGYAAALVQALLDLPDGQAGLWRYLGRPVGGEGDPLAVLEGCFPSLEQGKSTLEKLWTLSLARLSVSDRAHAMGAEQTDRALAAALIVAMPPEKRPGDPELFTLSRFGEFIRRKAAKGALIDTVAAIMKVRLRAHPLYAGLADGYLDAASALSKGKTRGVAEQLGRLESDRLALARLAQDIRDHLDWLEANQPGVESDVFRPYFRAEAAMGQARPVRRDAISRYLDSIEAELR